MPAKSGSPRLTVRSSPSGPMNSNAATAVARFPLRSPEPCVPVAIEPATEMWGSEAKLCSANPASWTARPSAAYVIHPEARTSRRSASIDTSGAIPLSESMTDGESAMALKEWPEPSTRSRGEAATISRAASTLAAGANRSGAKAMLPAQLASGASCGPPAALDPAGEAGEPCVGTISS